MGTTRTSRIPGFHRLSIEERRAHLAEFLAGDPGAFAAGLDLPLADRMVENVVGVFGMPLGVATNFVVDGREILVPMAIEEPSVIAGASNAARMVRAGGGFAVGTDPPHTVAQIEVLDPAPGAPVRVVRARPELLELANASQPGLVEAGGGARRLEPRQDVGDPGRLVFHLVVDCRDAMGANSVNTMAEAISGRILELCGGRLGLRILTNLADERKARARCEVPVEALARDGFDGHRVAEGVLGAMRFAAADPYRAATHNKGIFNGIDAVLLATGNDWRAVEAGGHAYAARSGSYSPLSSWRLEGDRLHGELELPLAVGIVGGAARAHPLARASIELLGVTSASELAGIVAACGLASNLAALAALGAEGIQHGHMRLHRRQGER